MQAQVLSINKRIEEQANGMMERRLDKQLAKIKAHREMLLSIMNDSEMDDLVSKELIEAVRRNMLDAHIDLLKLRRGL